MKLIEKNKYYYTRCHFGVNHYTVWFCEKVNGNFSMSSPVESFVDEADARNYVYEKNGWGMPKTLNR